MSSLLSNSSPFLLIDKNRFGFHRCCDVSSLTFGCSNSIVNFSLLKHRRVGLLYASIAERKMEPSWFPPDRNVDDDYGGWGVVETGIKSDKKKGFPKNFVVGTGVSVVILLAAIGYCSLSTKGFKFELCDTLHAFRKRIVTSDSTSQNSVADANESDVSSTVTYANPEYISGEITTEHASVSVEKIKRVIIPAVVDSTQHDALQVLKKLKIIEDDVKADELCTRREYARWLIKANSVLERNPKHRIVPSMLLAGSWIQAFDDVNIEDPDFWSIQALAEVGLLDSKLSGKSSTSADLDGLTEEGKVDFLPESCISRLDLLNWKAQLEYSFIPRIEGKISRKNIDLMDAKAISPDASVELFMDILAGDKSILRKVFGQSRRFQPDKPATIAQAAVTLTSGRMAVAIRTKLSRIEDDNRSRKAEMKEIRSELLSRGEIQRFWDVKMDELKAYGFEAERSFHSAILDLEQEKNVQGTWLAKLLKEKAALDCQRQLLLSLEGEVEEMSERITQERADLEVEKKDLEKTSDDLQVKQEAIDDAKSILEAEKEALQILRSWVEDEARQNHARAKVLEEVGRRWKWDGRD